MGLAEEAAPGTPPSVPQGIALVRPGLYQCQKDRAAMVWVPGGKFLMGAEDLGEATRPVHEVSLKGFFIDRAEVTNRQFAHFLTLRGKDADDEGRPMIYADVRIGIVKRGDEWTAVKGREEHPVVRVTWFGAAAYAAWAGKSLPTEAQWEYAASGSDGRLYPWGNAAPRPAGNGQGFCVFGRRPPDLTLPSGSAPDGASPFGCLDMAGNVAEWCRDWYDETFYGNSPVENPASLETREKRVVRGGSWYDAADRMRRASRGAGAPHVAEDTVGFRCVKELN
jgi:formylglycine-generating enzyme required for sulfatase activity